MQADLCKILLSFRMHRFAITADINKMFRQVQILWRRTKHKRIQEIVLTFVVLGFTSATFNAVRALRQCAMDNREQYPVASEVALSSFYVDDLLTGADDYEQLASLRSDLIAMLHCRGFSISKWTNSHPRLAAEHGQSSTQEVAIDYETGVLGMNLSNYDQENPEQMTK